MSDSTRRALRTAYQFVIALIAIVPTIALVLPNDSPIGADIAVVLGWLVIVSKLINSLEDRGAIPAWLKAPNTPAVAPVPIKTEGSEGSEGSPEPPAETETQAGE